MDKSYKVTESQRDFIGSKFPTPRGGELTITGVVTSKDGLSKNNTDCRFSAVCSLCSLDVELFPEEFIVVKCSLIKGCVPCGCSSQCKWSENQYFVRVKRECYSRGYEFLGWAGNFNGSKTKLKLYNPVTDNLWSSTTISKLFCGRGDPKIRTEVVKKARLKPHEVHIQDFYKAGFSKGYIFWKSELLDSRNGKPYWNYTCPYCSKDEFVESGVCSGVFTNTTSNLKKGVLSCRCSKGYRWTQKQREYQIDKICKEEGLTFTGWENNEGYHNGHEKFKWLCKEGHSCSTSLVSFLFTGSRCGTCWKEKGKVQGFCNGYYPERKDEKDHLYTINFNNEYIKVGRSFDIKSRIRGSKGLLKMSGMSLDQIVVLRILSSTHQKVYDEEQRIHKELTERGFYHEKSTWTVETFDTDAEDVIYKLLEGSNLVDENVPLY